VSIRITRLRRQYFRYPAELYLNDRLMGIWGGRESSADIEGNGRPQRLRVTSEDCADSEPIEVIDPGHDLLLGVLVTYTKRYKLFARSEKFLKAEVMGPPIQYVAPDTAPDTR
jgi:hypothetical protein